MQSIKCPQCGLVMLAGAPVCKSCGVPLQERRAQPPTSAYQVGSLDRDERQQSQPGTVSRLAFLFLVLGWLLLAASRHIGVIAWPIALVTFLAGVVTSVITIVRRIRSGDPNARLWRPATTISFLRAQLSLTSHINAVLLSLLLVTRSLLSVGLNRAGGQADFNSATNWPMLSHS